MDWMVFNCPQCSAPLPRQAMWRSVVCSYCGALVAKNETTIFRAPFREALLRQRAQLGNGADIVSCNGASFELTRTMLTLPEGVKYVLGQRVGAMPVQVLVKMGAAAEHGDAFAKERAVLQHFHSGKGALAGHYSRMIPPVIDLGLGAQRYADQSVLVLGLIPGVWGSLSSVLVRHPNGIDARHVVWMWRRLLDILGYVHSVGWVHASVRPETAWVNPEDHGMFLMDWSAAKQDGKAASQALDLQHSARLIRVMLSGALERPLESLAAPAGLIQLVGRACNDLGFCEQQGAKGIDALLLQAAQEAFGPPRFLEFQP